MRKHIGGTELSRYYIVTGDHKGFFAFEDGHYSVDVSFSRATGTHNLAEAARMREYAKEKGEAIIIQNLQITAETVSENEISEALRKSAADKLRPEELRDITQRGNQSE